MTKDVELHPSTWKSMKQAITGLTENVTVSSSGYGNYTNAQAGPYSTGTASTGFAKRVEDLVKISEKVQQMIKERDTDGVVSYTYHDETSTAQTLQSKLSTLERYAENVNNYIKNKIDQPFYEAMDKVGAKLEALSVQQYKTTNKVGYKRTDVIKDVYGNKIGTMQVTPDEIGIDELYKVDSPYKATLQKSYEEFKKSKDYKDHKLTQDQYLMAMHHTRSFEYVSIDDEKANIEMWRDIALGVGVVVLTIFCPPAGAVASVVVASADMYSAATGKDWGTGRELDNTERGMRGAFALFDLIPAGKYLSSLAKTGKTAGLTAVKTSLKTAIKEGVEQGAKNLDNLKGILKSTKGLGDNVYQSLSTYRKQLAHHIQNTVDEGVLNLSKAAQEGLERAKQFTLEVPTIRTKQLATVDSVNVQTFSRLDTTTVKLGDTGLGKGLDNLASKAKQVENTRLDKLRARNAFYTTKEEWMKAMKEGDVVFNTDIHSKIEILKQRGIISEVDDGTIELISNMRKGNYGEMTTDEIYRQLGYERISLDMTTEIDGATHHGIDGVYYNPNGHPPYIIAEAKYGSARLSYLKGGEIKQMSREWIDDRLKDAVGKGAYDEIDRAMKHGDVGYQLVKVRKNGDIMINNLDKKANIIRP
ncbi:pre-toxin TG domain-containing protein [Streptococcus infantis]|uniref:pre-toxin TG domain-containing protein n=1 Tax=Streptococcus infantis TaxID=68892 RepID=UPI0039C1BB02